MEATILFHCKETRCLRLPIMPKEFGVCMVYGRCRTWYDGARHTCVSRLFCPVGIFGSLEFLCSFFSLYCFLPFRKRRREKGGTLFEFWHSIPAFPMAILEIYGTLSVKAAGLFMSLYYINNGRLRFLKIIGIFTVFYM